MQTLSLRRRSATEPEPHANRTRNQFRLWLTLQLRLRGAQLPPHPSYAQLREATRQYLVPRA